MLNSRAIAEIVKCFPNAPELVKKHMQTRLKWCQYDEIAEYIPDKNSVLDIGCGFGHFAAYLNHSFPQNSYWGYDPDPEKIAVAKASTLNKNSNIHFWVGDILTPHTATFPAEGFTGIVLLDVLYLMPEDIQNRLLEALPRLLSAHGSIIIKTLDTKRKSLRYYSALTQEWIMVHILRRTFSRDKIINPRSQADYTALLQKHGLQVTLIPLPLNRTPSVLLVGKRNSG